MKYNELVEQLTPLVTDLAYANSQSGKNEIYDKVMLYLNSNFSENDLKNANINVNIIMGRTAVNDINSQAQSEVQVQVVHDEY